MGDDCEFGGGRASCLIMQLKIYMVILGKASLRTPAIGANLFNKLFEAQRGAMGQDGCIYNLVLGSHQARWAHLGSSQLPPYRKVSVIAHCCKLIPILPFCRPSRCTHPFRKPWLVFPSLPF